MNTVELTSVRKCYDEFVAVDDLSFVVSPGEIYGLLGPNGAGKTSTLRMMIGITVPDSGSVSMFGQPFRREHLRRVGYLPEERGLYRKMKIIEHLLVTCPGMNEKISGFLSSRINRREKQRFINSEQQDDARNNRNKQNP
jgi:ABC-type uncharacterized transport system ATPase subunit